MTTEPVVDRTAVEVEVEVGGDEVVLADAGLADDGADEGLRPRATAGRDHPWPGRSGPDADELQGPCDPARHCVERSGVRSGGSHGDDDEAPGRAGGAVDGPPVAGFGDGVVGYHGEVVGTGVEADLSEPGGVDDLGWGHEPGAEGNHR